MKTIPKEERIQQRLQPGVLTTGGFLGQDSRNWNEIIAEDALVLDKSGYTREQIADRMQEFMDKAFDSYLGPMEIDGRYSVEYEAVRGKMVCPFLHAGNYRKGYVIFVNKTNGIRLEWTPLNVHLIRDHGFFQGRGSKHRLDPETLIKALFE